MTSKASDYNRITIDEVKDFLQHTSSCIEGLRSAVSMLPEVDANGNSECRFAKELYKQKEEAQRKVEACLDKLFEYAKWTDDQIRRCKNNLVVISANADRLNSDLPRRDFSEAEVKLAALYKRLIRLRVKVKKAIKLCHEAIREASSRRYPDDGEEAIEADSVDGCDTEPTDEQMDDLLRKMLMMDQTEQ